MLVLVHFAFALCIAHTEERFVFDVIIMSVDVGKGMVYHDVLDVPEKSAAPKQVQGERSKAIHRFVPGKTSVAAIGTSPLCGRRFVIASEPRST